MYNILQHREILKECVGCAKIQYSLILKKEICLVETNPQCAWLFGICKNATHIEDTKDD